MAEDIHVIDTNVLCTPARLERFKAAGIKTIIRYVAAGLVWSEKVVKPPEARDFIAHGMRLGLVYEIGGKPNGAAVGRRDGQYAAEYAPTVGAAPGQGICLWYTVDYDAGPANMPGIIEAFRAFKAAVSPAYTVGAYASGAVCDDLYNRGLITKRWITMSQGFRGSRPAISAGRWEMLQRLDRTIAGINVDPNVVQKDSSGKDVGIGDFVPNLGAPQELKGSIAWAQASLNRLTGANLDVDNINGPFTIRAVERFQQEHGLDVDGVVGPQTTKAIQAELDKLA